MCLSNSHRLKTLLQLQGAEPVPTWLDEIVAKAEVFGGLATRIRQVLCTEYDVGGGIGWHRDKPKSYVWRNNWSWMRAQLVS